MSFLVSGLTKDASHLVGDLAQDTSSIIKDAVGNVSQDLETLVERNDAKEAKEDIYKLPGCEILGSGYDVLNGFYASPKSCLSVLFKFSDTSESIKVGTRVFNKPTDISYHSSFYTNMYTSSGQTIDEYTKSVSSRTKVEGSYNFFSGSFEADFGESSAESQENAFSKVNYKVEQYTLQLPPKHPEYLDPKVQKDIDEMSDLTKLFQMYGTHYLAGLIMGGSAAYSSVTKKSHFNSKHDLSVAAEMSFKSAVGSMSAEEKVTYGSTVKSFKESSTSNTTTFGGDPRYGNEKFPQFTDEWSASVGDYLTFIDFLGERSLVGIWELASTEKRNKEIKDFYPLYCEAHQRKFITTEGPLLQAKIVPLAKVPFTDINSGAEGNVTAAVPDIGGGWYYLGQVALSGGSREPRGNTLLVKEIKKGVLVDVGHWEKVWDDHGSKKDLNYNLWRGVAYNPVDYQVLGDFFRGQVNNQYAPSKEEAEGIKAVSVSCLVPVKVGAMIWSDKGSKASDDGSIWKIVPENPSEAIDMSRIEPYFVSGKSWNKPARQVYVLKKDAVQFV